MSKQSPRKTLSPNELSDLAQKDPAALQQYLDDQVEQIISSAPEHMQQRLRGLQFQIDAERRKHDNPLGACVAISKMMMDSVHELSQVLNGEHPRLNGDREPEKADVINLFDNKT